MKLSTPKHPHEDYYPDDETLCRLLKVYPDTCSAFLWQAGVCVSGDDFGGSADLETRFSKWADEFPGEPKDWQGLDFQDEHWQGWKQRGQLLCEELRRTLPQEYTMFCYPFPDPHNEPIEIKNSPS